MAEFALTYPNAKVSMEVGTHSPWVSRFLESKGMTVTVANPRKLRAIYANVRKSDELDARMLGRLLRVDEELLFPITHCAYPHIPTTRRLFLDRAFGPMLLFL